MNAYNPKDWYWQIGSDQTQFWSSKNNAFVAASDTAYSAWYAHGNSATPVASLAIALGVIVKQTGLLEASDTTMLRITEAVALGLTTWTTPDVVDFVNYRRSLRAVAAENSNATQIPTRPAYPTGT